jgi:hypothetical protein
VEIWRSGARWHLLHFAKDGLACIASERFLLPETGSLLFVIGRAVAACIVPETALSYLV